MKYEVWITAAIATPYSLLLTPYSCVARRHIIGVHGDEETPVPIPNTEVKLVSGDYTAQAGN